MLEWKELKCRVVWKSSDTYHLPSLLALGKHQAVVVEIPLVTLNNKLIEE